MKFHKPTWDFLGKRKRAYQLKFPKLNREHDLVILDIIAFCRLFETTAIPGDRDRSLMLEGRREVALRIFQHLDEPMEQLYHRYGGAILTEGKPNE